LWKILGDFKKVCGNPPPPTKHRPRKGTRKKKKVPYNSQERKKTREGGGRYKNHLGKKGKKTKLGKRGGRFRLRGALNLQKKYWGVWKTLINKAQVRGKKKFANTFSKMGGVGPISTRV